MTWLILGWANAAFWLGMYLAQRRLTKRAMANADTAFDLLEGWKASGKIALDLLEGWNQMWNEHKARCEGAVRISLASRKPSPPRA